MANNDRLEGYSSSPDTLRSRGLTDIVIGYSLMPFVAVPPMEMCNVAYRTKQSFLEYCANEPLVSSIVALASLVSLITIGEFFQDANRKYRMAAEIENNKETIESS